MARNRVQFQKGLSEVGFVTLYGTEELCRAARHPAFRWVKTMLGNIKCAITGTYRALRKKHMVRYLAEFECRFNHRFDLAQPYWWLKMADYGA